MTPPDATQGEEARADVAYLKHLAETERPYFGKDAQEALTRLLERVARAEEALTQIAGLESVVQQDDGPWIVMRDEQMREIARAALKEATL